MASDELPEKLLGLMGWYLPELYRVRGEALDANGGDCRDEAEASLNHALGIAREQQAKSSELRAAMSLSRLWVERGERQRARDLLAPVYGWFAEGLTTRDLIEAKLLLDALA